MSQPVDMIGALQEAVKARVQSSELVAASKVPVFADDAGDLATLVDKAANARGLALIVLVPRIAPEPQGCLVTVAVQVEECALVNRARGGTNITGRRMAQNAWAMLAQWSPPDLEYWEPLQFAGLSLLSLQPKIVWELQMTTATLTDVTTE